MKLGCEDLLTLLVKRLHNNDSSASNTNNQRKRTSIWKTDLLGLWLRLWPGSGAG